MTTPDGYWFHSSKFEIEPEEDADINPRVYGRQLAKWLKQRLEECGYSVEEIIDEDWGRCVMCSRDPFMLWVGCGNLTDDAAAGSSDKPPDKEAVLWHCFAMAEVVFWKRRFRKIDAEPARVKLHLDLGRILASEPEIELVERA